MHEQPADQVGMTSPASRTTHFGFRDVRESDKSELVKGVFDSVVGRYDLMNDLMSMGLHRIWKRFAVSQSGLATGNHALDVAAGSGDLSVQLVEKVGRSGTVTVTDVNPIMLDLGKRRIIDSGCIGNVFYALADAENLPFEDDRFHSVVISFGLRNVTRQDRALASMYRVLRPGSRLLVLEFSRPVLPLLEKIYDSYSFQVIPRIGKLVAQDQDSYRYLVESIRKHPDQDTLKAMMVEAGFEDIRVHNLSGGIVALHVGIKY